MECRGGRSCGRSHIDPAHGYRARQETYADRDSAQARVDELNAARHTTGTSALADARARGEQPFGFYAKGWLQQQGVKAASRKLKADNVDAIGSLLSSTPANCPSRPRPRPRSQRRYRKTSCSCSGGSPASCPERDRRCPPPTNRTHLGVGRCFEANPAADRRGPGASLE